ncbi:hypothetical protein HanPI659440_Chr02g0039831 [Helianthus annuus]|nr:hypothetical protein HanPI659440_Chr02g0039831 [Helianthus annuus]
MPILWRALFTIEEILEEEDLDFGLSELAYLYSLVTHGSSRFLFKAKFYQPLPILKTTQNDSTWKNQFFFVRRDSIPNGDSLPKNWILKVTNFARLAELPGTEESVFAFLPLDRLVRTFNFIIMDSQEEEEVYTSSSYNMSSAQKSANKSATKFGLDDIDNILSPRSAKKEPFKGQSFSEPRAVITRGKAGSKRKTLAEPEGDALETERQLHESVTEGFAHVKAYFERNMVDLEENLPGMRSTAAAKDKAKSKLEKEKKGLEE